MFSMKAMILNCYLGFLLNNIIDQIEKSISEKNISKFFIPTIISLLPKKIVILALYSSLSYLQSGWYEELIKKLDVNKNSEEYKRTNFSHI